jgi:alkanesulfonate monooxygenase SsuD/methylene tetrahydromethanopterin reductase-like flavin-dependent oxidoreductase (luciferase family)
VWLAKATASLAAVSGGRFTLGVAAGGRSDDYVAFGRPFERRGRLLDETLDLLRRAWAGEPVAGGEFAVGPRLDRPVPVLVGGDVDAAMRRMVEYGDGWTAGGGGPERMAPAIERVRRAWREGGREGEPRLVALIYFGLGDEPASRASLRRYYGFLGQWTDAIVESAVRSPEAARAAATAFADIGVTELIFDPTVADVDEVNRLADAVL